MKGKIYLFPSTLGDSPINRNIPPQHIELLKNMRHFVVEDLRTARRFLKKACPEIIIDDLIFHELNEHTPANEIFQLLEPAQQGNDMALISEAGLPCVADPGAAFVEFAHALNIRVVPLPGPSSVYLALMASGMNGQNFSFTGYLPIDKKERAFRIKQLESDAWQKDQTQIFIETPYRNNQLLEALLHTCKSETRLCVAMNITLGDEWICSQTIDMWRKSKTPDLQKKPAVFLLYR